MLVKYYKSSDLAYANRKRYTTFNFTADSEEEQRAVKLGDGANTTVTTDVANLCNYVKIGDTRWYVVSYTYLNGKQVKLFLQRDVVGEFGLSGCSGKIERGYTNTFLRNRKELDLNQRLINRIPVIPNSFEYGNYKVNTHNKEKWGIIYISKPTQGEGGNPPPSSINIPIPAFAPSNYDSNLDFVENGSITYSGNNYNTTLHFSVLRDRGNVYNCSINFYFDQVNGVITYDYNVELGRQSHENKVMFIYNAQSPTESYEDSYATLKEYLKRIAQKILDNYNNNITISSYNLPKFVTIGNAQITPETTMDLYNNKSLLKDGLYYDCDVVKETTNSNPSILGGSDFYNQLVSWLDGIQISYIKPSTGYSVNYTFHPTLNTESDYSSWNVSSNNYCVKATWTVIELSPSSSGVLVVDLTQDLVDEPYIIYAIPLFDVTIKDVATDGTVFTKTVTQSNAFLTFNTAIQYLSGENGYLVDAQIYPYCPNLRDYNVDVNNVPVFTLMQTSFERICSLQLNQYSDIKKEYIKRQYSIIAPDQSSKFTFNYYDYSNKINDNNGISSSITTIIVKTALKPFNIISSAVVIPDNDSLIGKTYESDIRGCQSVSSGFECSISTDQFQQYVRNNVNYEKLFNLDKEELQKQHSIERVNENTSLVVNTLTATAMGAIGGASMADIGIWNSAGAKAAGAIAGGAIAGTTVGIAMDKQRKANEELRAYEENLQQQRFNYSIGTVKNLPNQVSRISSFNEIIMKNYYYVVEVYQCSDAESLLVDDFVEKYSYGLGILGQYTNFVRNGWFIRGTLISSNFISILHNVLSNELKGGIYIYD